jgi:hypothetical protein
MNSFSNFTIFAYRVLIVFAAGCLFFLMTGSVSASNQNKDLPSEVTPALHYLLDLARSGDGAAFDVRRIDPFMQFLLSPKPTDVMYTADGSFGAPSAYNDYMIGAGLKDIIEYTLDVDIPSFFFWPSSLRLSQWTQVDGGDEQFTKLKETAGRPTLKTPFVFTGVEHIAITPDQHTGAYYSYDTDKMVILTPYRDGKALINIFIQKDTSDVGRKGWVLGKDDEWSYLYTKDKGLNVKGLGWANTYMYDSFGCSVYYEADPATPAVKCGTVSWVKAGWAKINMVKPKHIHRGLVRVAEAFTTVMESPKLPEPAKLAKTFSRSKYLPASTLREDGKDYFNSLEQSLSLSGALRKKVGDSFDRRTLLDQMTRDELYAVLALDYFKMLLGRDHVMVSYPF